MPGMLGARPLRRSFLHGHARHGPPMPAPGARVLAGTVCIVVGLYPSFLSNDPMANFADFITS
jgi:hypothetical protein